MLANTHLSKLVESVMRKFSLSVVNLIHHCGIFKSIAEFQGLGTFIVKNCEKFTKILQHKNAIKGRFELGFINSMLFVVCNHEFACL